MTCLIHMNSGNVASRVKRVDIIKLGFKNFQQNVFLFEILLLSMFIVYICMFDLLFA